MIALTALAKALRGIDCWRNLFGSFISPLPMIIWAEITAVGMATMADMPGMGIGTCEIAFSTPGVSRESTAGRVGFMETWRTRPSVKTRYRGSRTIDP